MRYYIGDTITTGQGTEITILAIHKVNEDTVHIVGKVQRDGRTLNASIRRKASVITSSKFVVGFDLID